MSNNMPENLVLINCSNSKLFNKLNLNLLLHFSGVHPCACQSLDKSTGRFTQSSGKGLKVVFNTHGILDQWLEPKCFPIL